MAIEQIGLNFSNIENLTSSLNLSIPTTPSEILTQIPLSANITTNHYYGWIIMFILTIMLYIIMSDRTPFGDFLYSDSRSLTIALGISSVWGITNMEINFFTNFQSVASFIVLFLIFFIAILFFENKE